jgi:uncharacterized protein
MSHDLPRVLILPGWQNSGPLHWQSRWQAAHGFERVEQADWDWPRRGDWMARLDETLLADDKTAVLAAHSLGCQLVAAWAAHSRHTARVRGALLVAPPDTARADMPPQLAGWRTIVMQRLPFAAHVVYSDDDPFCTIDRARAMAAAWGARATALGARGHLNSESGLGDWSQGLAWLTELRGLRECR